MLRLVDVSRKWTRCLYFTLPHDINLVPKPGSLGVINTCTSRTKELTFKKALVGNIWEESVVGNLWKPRRQTATGPGINCLTRGFLLRDRHHMPFFFCGAAAQSGPWVPHFLVFYITPRHTTVGRTPLDEWSARHRTLYLTTLNTHNRQISMPPAGF